MAEIASDLSISRPSSAGSPPNCAICLGHLTNKCLSDSCMHQFCFTCLLQWSKIKPECPLCKQRFTSIKHNCKPNGEYDTFVVKPVDEVHLIESDNFVDDIRLIDNDQYLYLPTPPPAHHEFLFRTTFTVDTRGEHAIQQMLLSHPLTNAISITGFGPTRIAHHRRRRDTSATSFRRSIYNQNLWVYAPPDMSGRYRDVTPRFYRENPAARTRLAPWLNRELNALLMENTQQVMRLVDIIMDLLLVHHICSRTFRTHLHEYLGNKTDHFVHEFYNFMRSPYDMIGYDRHVTYTERPRSPTPFIDVSDVEYSSDVIIIGSDNETNNNRNNIVDVIDLVETDSDEPIIVSEEPPPNQQRSNLQVEERHDPAMPIKLRIKRKRHTSSKRNHTKRRRHHRSRSTCSCSSSSSTSSTEDEESSLRRHKRKKRLVKYVPKWKNKKNQTESRPQDSSNSATNSSSSSSTSTSTTSSSSTSTSTSSASTSSSSSTAVSKSDSDSDVPLARYAKTHNGKVKHSHSVKSSKLNKKCRSHTVTRPENLRLRSPFGSEWRQNRPTCTRYLDSHTPPLAPVLKTEQDLDSWSTPRPLNLCIKDSDNASYSPGNSMSCNMSPVSCNLSPGSTIVENTTNPDISDVSDIDFNYAPYRNVKVKSEIREVKKEEQDYHAGPSGGSSGEMSLARKREESRNLWYSRPGFLKFDSDSPSSE